MTLSPTNARRDCRSTGEWAGTSSSSASVLVARSEVIESSAAVGRRPAVRECAVEAGGHARLQEARDQDLVEVGVLDAHGYGVGAAQALPVDDGVALGDDQGAGQARAGLLAAGQQGLGLGEQGAPRHLLGEPDESRVGPGSGHEGATTGDPLEEAFGDEGVHGLAHGHPRNAEAVHELALGGHGRAGRGIVDQAAKVFADLDVLQLSAGRQDVVHVCNCRTGLVMSSVAWERL